MTYKDLKKILIRKTNGGCVTPNYKDKKFLAHILDDEKYLNKSFLNRKTGNEYFITSSQVEVPKHLLKDFVTAHDLLALWSK